MAKFVIAGTGEEMPMHRNLRGGELQGRIKETLRLSQVNATSHHSGFPCGQSYTCRKGFSEMLALTLLGESCTRQNLTLRAYAPYISIDSPLLRQAKVRAIVGLQLQLGAAVVEPAQSWRGISWLAGLANSDEFFTKYWDRLPLHVMRKDRNFYESIVSRIDVEGIIAAALRNRPPNRSRPSVELVSGAKSAGTVRLRNSAETASEMWAAYAGGSTILVQMAQQYSPMLGRLCAILEEEFRAPIDATLICTPRHSQAFGRHFDRLNALVIQLDGRKEWRLFGTAIDDPVQELPILPFESAEMAHRRLSKWLATDRAESSLTESLTLEPGDFLYVPRGQYHEVWADSDASAHITLAIKPITYLDLMLAALSREAERNPELRRTLQVRGSGEPDAMSHMAELLKDFSANLDVRRAQGDLNDAFAQTHRTAPEEPQNGDAQLTVDTLLERVSSDSPKLLYSEENVELYFGERLFRIPRIAGPALEFIATAPRFTASELPGLSSRSALTLVNRLVRSNVLRPASAPIQPATYKED